MRSPHEEAFTTTENWQECWPWVSDALDKVTALPPLTETEPPQAVDGELVTVTPLGSRSVNEMPVCAGSLFMLVMVKVAVDVPLAAIFGGLKTLASTGVRTCTSAEFTSTLGSPSK